MTTLDERYPDLLGHGDDPELARLVADLDSAYTASTPPPHLRASLQRALHERTPALHDRRLARPAPRWFARRSRRVAIVVALVAAIALVGSAVADPTLVDQALSMWAGTAQVATQHLGEDVNLSQSACGFTMTISRVYADANRIIVGYTLTGPAGRRFNNINATPTLADAQGHTLPGLEGAGTGVMGSQSGNYMAFDAGSVAASAGTLQ